MRGARTRARRPFAPLAGAPSQGRAGLWGMIGSYFALWDAIEPVKKPNKNQFFPTLEP
jgi:hypothetical protein